MHILPVQHFVSKLVALGIHNDEKKAKRWCYLGSVTCRMGSHLPLDTGEHVPTQPQLDRPVLDLPTPEGWKAELT